MSLRILLRNKEHDPFYSSLLLSTTLVTACASTDVGNPISTEIEFAGYQGAGPQPDALVLDNGLTVEEAFIKVRSFQLDRSEACDDVDNSFDGVVLVDLLEQTQSDAPFGWMKRVRFAACDSSSQPTLSRASPLNSPMLHFGSRARRVVGNPSRFS